MNRAGRIAAHWLAALRSPMTAQIGPSITLVSLLLVGSSSYLVVRMTSDWRAGIWHCRWPCRRGHRPNRTNC